MIGVLILARLVRVYRMVVYGGGDNSLGISCDKRHCHSSLCKLVQSSQG